MLIILPKSNLGDTSIGIHTGEDRQVFETFRSISKQSNLVLILYGTELLSAITVDQLDGLFSAISTDALKLELNVDQ